MCRFVPIIHASRADRPDEADTLVAAESVAGALSQLGYAAEIVPIDLDLSILERLAARRPHAVFNLVEAIRGDDRLSPVVPPVLEHLGLPFTGSGSAAYAAAQSKLATKQALASAGLPTPPWWTSDAPVPPGETVIIKSVSAHGSFGMDGGSVVPGRLASAQVRAREARFGGRFFAERFLDGREFNVGLLEHPGGVEVLPIPEIDFTLPPGRPRIVDYEAKWDAASPAYGQTGRRFGVELAEPALAATLADLARRCWHSFGLAGYARVDLRIDGTGRPFILEVNANPCLAPDAGFIATAEEAGIPYVALVGRIVAAAARETRTAAACSAS